MKALKLKIIPTKEQYSLLDVTFRKWAALCTHMSTDNLEHSYFNPPENSSGKYFNKNQLNTANTDVKDIRKTLKKSVEQKKRELTKSILRQNDIMVTIESEKNRDFSPGKMSTFRPKKWAEKGLLKAKFHSLQHWKKEAEKLRELIEKKEIIIRKIEAGKITFAPRRLTLKADNVLISIADKKLILKPFDDKSEIILDLLTQPEQPEIGKNKGISSKNSKEYLQNAILDLIKFAVHSILLGMNRSEKLLLKAKKPDKIAKKERILKNKKESVYKKLKEIEKIVARKLSVEETNSIIAEFEHFFAQPNTEEEYFPSHDYTKTIERISYELFLKKEPFKLKKYPLLIRKQKNRYRTKKSENARPEEWDYYIQFGYEQMRKPRIEPETILGIDRGITHLLAIAVYDPKQNKFTINKLIPNPVKNWKNRNLVLRKSLHHLEQKIRAQKQEHIFENQMKQQIKSLENKIKNLYHNVSKEIITLAVENRSAIVLESLERTGLRQHGRKKNEWTKKLNYTLSLFDYAKIAQMIQYKAECAGIPVYDILPAYTSKNCAKCLLEKGEQENTTYIRGINNNSKVGKCQIHGEIDADLNAARTIAVCYYKGINQPMPFETR